LSIGGAAVGGIVATGLAGASVAVGTVIMGALDDIKTPAPELKENFLSFWRGEIGETSDEEKTN
jgi:hypothetical protein